MIASLVLIETLKTCACQLCTFCKYKNYLGYTFHCEHDCIHVCKKIASFMNDVTYDTCHNTHIGTRGVGTKQGKG